MSQCIKCNHGRSESHDRWPAKTLYREKKLCWNCLCKSTDGVISVNKGRQRNTEGT